MSALLTAIPSRKPRAGAQDWTICLAALGALVERRDRPGLPDRVGAPQERLALAGHGGSEVAQLTGVRIGPFHATRSVEPSAPRTSITGSRECHGSSMNSEPSEPTTSSS